MRENIMLSEFTKIIALINPVSGNYDATLEDKLTDILAHNKGFTIYKTKNKQDTQKYLKDVTDEETLVIAAGGDGTVQEVAGVAVKTNASICIFPAGTANVLASELEVNFSNDNNVQALNFENLREKRIDVGFVNDEVFLGRTCFGLLADMIVESSAEMKSIFGNSVYAMNFLKNYSHKEVTYKIETGGTITKYNAAGLLVANSAHLGVTSLSYFEDIKIDDGYLNFILLKNLGLTTLIKAISREIIGEDIPEIQKIQFKEAIVTVKPKQTVIRDDIEITSETYNFRVEKQKLRMLVPITKDFENECNI